MRWSIGPVGVKDLFTLVNLLGGVFGVYFVMHHRPVFAGAAVMLGYLCGDTLDGYVARLTKTSNAFGGELDTATDHFVQAIVPALIVYEVFSRGGHGALGLALLAIMVTCATVRQALFTVAKMGDPLMYCGLPRTVSGFASMALVLSRFFFRQTTPSFVIAAVLIAAFSIMGLLPIPYMTHRGTRRMQTYVKILVVLFLVMPSVVFVVAREFTFDVVFFYMAGYALTAWIPLRRDERQRFFTRYRQWAAEVSRA